MGGQEKVAWEQMSSFSPTLGENDILEKFLTELSAYLFNRPKKTEISSKII